MQAMPAAGKAATDLMQTFEHYVHGWFSKRPARLGVRRLILCIPRCARLA
jgi:hypothetical protein